MIVVSAVLDLLYEHTDAQTDIDGRYNHTTVVGVSNNNDDDDDDDTSHLYLPHDDFINLLFVKMIESN